MTPINTLTSTAAPLPLPNIDTDQIIPKQFLKRIERTGYGDFLFYDWRRIAADSPRIHPDDAERAGLGEALLQPDEMTLGDIAVGDDGDGLHAGRQPMRFGDLYPPLG